MKAQMLNLFFMVNPIPFPYFIPIGESTRHRGEDEDLLREALRWNPFALRFASPALANRKAGIRPWRSGGENMGKSLILLVSNGDI